MKSHNSIVYKIQQSTYRWDDFDSISYEPDYDLLRGR